MKKSVQELVDKNMFPVKLPITQVKAFKANGVNFKDDAFLSEEVAVISIKRATKDAAYQIEYFNTKSQSANTVTVPKDFNLRLLKGFNGQKIMAKYDNYLKRNIKGQLGYTTNVGSDPEVFVVNSKDELIPAFNFLKSKKLSDKTAENCGVYWDGFQAEFETAANTCFSYHCDSIHYGLKKLLELARQYDKTAKLSLKTVMDIPINVIKKTDPEYVAFGCMKSLNVYGHEGIQLPGDQVYYRSAGGHIHFGIGKKTKEETTNIVKALDAILGVACVSMFGKFDDARRRQMYGLAGEYRLPPHGLEYRTLSNAWLMHPVVAHMVFDLGRSALMFGKLGFMKFWTTSEEETIRIINECDVEAAKLALNDNMDVFMQILSQRYGGEDTAKSQFACDIIMNGVETLVEDPYDLEKNWSLTNKKWTTHSEGIGKSVANALKVGGKV